MTLEENDLKLIRDSLPTDAATKLAEMNQCTDSYIRMVLKGERNNLSIIEQAISMAERNQDKIIQLQTKIQKINEPQRAN